MLIHDWRIHDCLRESGARAGTPCLAAGGDRDSASLDSTGPAPSSKDNTVAAKRRPPSSLQLTTLLPGMLQQ